MQDQVSPARNLRWRRMRSFVTWLLVAVLTWLLWGWWHQRVPVPPTEIYQGIAYGCDRLSPNQEGHGLLHWVRVDLTAPGIEIYVTPLDPDALTQGWQYRLQTVSSVVKGEHLAVGVNACLFTSESGWIPLPGDLARSVETVVSDHRVSHVWEHTYLLWFGDDLTPHLETSKPPSEAALSQARWGVGGQGIGLRGGKAAPGADSAQPDARTAVGIDKDRKLLFLAVFESATPKRAMEKLAALGAKEGILLDGGDSTSMALGSKARGVRPGSLLSGWRPAVATHLGVRVKPLPRGGQ